jgi:transposase
MDDARLMLTDETWDRLAAALAEVKSRAGAPPKQSDRDFIEAVLHLARTGEPWRDLPERFGRWDAVYQRFRRWEQAGRWRALFARLPEDLQAVHTVFFDSSVVRAHPHAAGAPKTKGGQQAQALGRSRGGFGTKIHLAAADETTALDVVLTPGQAGDAPQYPALIAGVPEACPVQAAAADKSYDSDAIRADLKRRGIAPVIPPLACRKEAIPYDKTTYRQRNKVERLFNRLKQFRRVATRYDKLDETFLAFIHLTAALITIR